MPAPQRMNPSESGPEITQSELLLRGSVIHSSVWGLLVGLQPLTHVLFIQ